MAESEGEGTAQKGQSGDEGSQPFKVYETEADFGNAMDKKFRSGYNEARSKDLEKLGGVLGGEFESIDDVVGQVKSLQQKVADGVDDPTQAAEYKQLQEKYNTLKDKNESLKEQTQTLEMQNQVDRKIAEGFTAVKKTHQFDDATVGESEVRELFDLRHGSKRIGGKLVATRKDPQLDEQVPVTDDDGNHKPFEQVFADFAKNYAVPIAEGAGGGTGGGEATTKPKRSEYREAVQAGNEETVEKLEQRAEEAGGFVEDVSTGW